MTDDLRLELAIPPEWDRIDAARRAVLHGVAATYSEPDLAEAVSMVAAQLLENAVKYGAPGAARISLSVVEHEGELVVEVQNAVDPDAGHADKLGQRLAWLAGFSAAVEAYMAALSEVYDRPE